MSLISSRLYTAEKKNQHYVDGNFPKLKCKDKEEFKKKSKECRTNAKDVTSM